MRVDLRGHLLRLVDPLEMGDELVGGFRLADASTELGLRLTFRSHEQAVHVEVAPVEEVERYAVRTERLAISYRTGGGDGHTDEGVGMALCEAVAQRVREREVRVLAELAAEARSSRRADEDGRRIREITSDRLLEIGGNSEERFYTLSPYVGCLIGCRFCYAQSRVGQVRRLMQLPEVPWGSYVDVRTNAPELLREELKHAESLPLKFCPIVSDPYQAVEKKYRITRACLEVIRDASPSPATMVLTRSPTIVEDAALIASIPRSFAACSIPTIDDDVRRHFEPRGAPIPTRLEVLASLRAAGANTCAVVQPILPGSIEGLADALSRVVGSVSIDVLHGVEGAGDDFADPRYSPATDPGWQLDRARELERLLADRGIRAWAGELPPELRDGA